MTEQPSTLKLKKITTETITNDKNIYIQKVEFNGKEHNRNYIRLEGILDGGTLLITLGSLPNKDFGAPAKNRQ